MRHRGMARAPARIVLLLAGALLLSQVPAPSSAQSAAEFTPGDEAPEDYPDAPGREETFYACTACHGFKIVAQQGLTRRQWDESLDWMQERHGMPELDAEERKLILDYLEAAYPPRQPAGRGGWQNPFLKR
ncbi:MAG: hypothetical protein KIT20_00720 [Alphaproteobacteria bacterium]|nr:hypothetical protein [Alphaproteobacteria bacterium]